MLAKYRSIAVAACLMVFAGACRVGGSLARVEAPAASQRPYADDIPLPAKFILADHSSEDWASGTLRYLRHLYRGRGDKHLIRRFYREQMPLARWSAVSESAVAGRCTMAFEKGNETCTVSIEDATSLLTPIVEIGVLIAPKAIQAAPVSLP